jgi:hypothetical protein
LCQRISSAQTGEALASSTMLVIKPTAKRPRHEKNEDKQFDMISLQGLSVGASVTRRNPISEE